MSGALVSKTHFQNESYKTDMFCYECDTKTQRLGCRLSNVRTCSAEQGPHTLGGAPTRVPKIFEGKVAY